MQKDDVIVRNAIIHILDSAVGMPVLSDDLLEMGPELSDLVRSHIYRIVASDDLKQCVFDEEGSDVYEVLKGFSEDSMVEASQQLATLLYPLMNQNLTIPPADFLVATYQVESTMHLALLKLNYKETFMHLTAPGEHGNFNDIVKQTATLPSMGSRLSEAILINLSDYSVKLVEKKYEVNGAKTNYLSELYLHCHAKMSQKTKMNLVTKAVEQINKKYYEEDAGKVMEAKSILQNEVAEVGAIRVEAISEKIYGGQPEIQQEFEEKLDKYHLVKEEIKPQNQATVKKLEKQYLTTDTGIEINIPMEEYKNSDRVEFITNIDGTISVLIKNISRLNAK